MNFKKLIFGAMAFLAVVSSCQKNNSDGVNLEVDQDIVELDATESFAELAVFADCSWSARCDADWLVVSPKKGTGNAKVTVMALANTGVNREAVIKFQKSTTAKVYFDVTVKQAGDKGEDGAEEISIAEFIQKADEATEYVVEGKVSSVDSNAAGTYKAINITDGTNTLCVFFPENFDEYSTILKSGYTVKAKGKYKLYEKNGTVTHEMVNGKILSYEEGEPDEPGEVQQITCAEFIEKADPNTTYRLVGDVTSSVNATYCSFDMNDGTATVVVWTVNNKDEWKDKVKQGGKVTVRGKYLKYEKDGNVKHEMVDAYIEKFEEGEAPGPVEAIDVTVAQFNAAEVSTTQYYRISGEVSGSINLNYGNFDVVDETGSVYVYGLDNIAEVKDKLVAGAKITVTGTRGEYNGKIEMLNGHCEKIEEPDAPGEVINATVAEFNAAVVGNQQYRLTGKISADATINTQYGNFDLVDATGSVYVYGLSNIADVKDKLLPNADITIVGTRGEYNGKIEVMNATCESVSGGDEPEPGPTEGTVYNATDYTWSENTHATYGAGYQGVKTDAPTLGYYKHQSTSNPVAQSGDHIRIYKNSAFTVSSEKEFTKLVMTVTNAQYAVAAKVLVGGGAVSADNAKLTVTWEGPATKELVLHATEGQIRASKFEFVFGEGGEEGEHYTLDQVNAMDCYIYEYGDGRYVCDADLYVADVENNTYSHNLDVYVPLIINEKNKIAGNHTMAIDPDYYEYYGYTTNEGDFSPFTEGTINISYVSQGVDSEGDNVYFYNVVIAGKLQNGQAFNLTVNNCRVYAVDIDDEDWPYIDLADGTKAGMSGKAVKTVKASRQIVKRK